MASSWSRLALGIAVVAACSDENRAPNVTFARVPESEPVPVTVIGSDSTITPAGYRVAEVHVMLPANLTEGVARVTLQRVIDSVAAVDTTAARIRVVGFVIGEIDQTTGEAEVTPAITALWEPTDSVGVTGSARTARFITNFRLLQPFAPDTGQSMQ